MADRDVWKAYRDFLRSNDLAARITSLLDEIAVDDIKALTAAGDQIRNWILETPLPDRLHPIPRFAKAL